MKLQSVQLHQGVNFFFAQNNLEGFRSSTPTSFNIKNDPVELEIPTPESTVLLIRFMDHTRKKELMRAFVSMSMVHSGIFLPPESSGKESKK